MSYSGHDSSDPTRRSGYPQDLNSQPVAGPSGGVLPSSIDPRQPPFNPFAPNYTPQSRLPAVSWQSAAPVDLANIGSVRTSPVLGLAVINAGLSTINSPRATYSDGDADMPTRPRSAGASTDTGRAPTHKDIGLRNDVDGHGKLPGGPGKLNPNRRDSYDDSASDVTESVFSGSDDSPRPPVPDVKIEDLELFPGTRKIRKLAKSLKYQLFTREAARMIEKMIGNEETRRQLLNLESCLLVLAKQLPDVSRHALSAVFSGPAESGLQDAAFAYADGVVELTGGKQIIAHAADAMAFWVSKSSRVLHDEENMMKLWVDHVIEQGKAGHAGPYVVAITNLHLIMEAAGDPELTAKAFSKLEGSNRIFVMMGNAKSMAVFDKHARHFPYRFKFGGYNLKETWMVLWREVEGRWDGKMQVEGGSGGQFFKQLARQVFAKYQDRGGSRANLEEAIDDVHKRQLNRIPKANRHGLSPNVWMFTREDLLGKTLDKALGNSVAWAKLQAMAGLDKVKQSIQNTADTVVSNYNRAIQDLEPVQTGLCRLFLGPPGTGKTTIAKLYGQILADLGVLSNGGLVIKNASDLIGSHVGESEKQTSKILEEAKGKVLLIDEAYMLDPFRAGSNAADPYRQAAVDTIVGIVQNTPGEDRCVIMTGYEEDMDKMLRGANPGLTRRFPKGDAFVFENFTDQQLSAILEVKLKQQDLSATVDAKAVTLSILKMARNKPNFGNGGDIENPLSKAKANYQTHYADIPVRKRPVRWEFQSADFDPSGKLSLGTGVRLEAGQDLTPIVQDDESIAALFAGFHNFEETVSFFKDLSLEVKGMRVRGKDPAGAVPFTYIFTGPPGTGKTVTARKIGTFLHELVMLTDGEVVEVSVTDPMSEYVGGTGPKVRDLLKSSLGKVLFIDEAYRLHSTKTTGHDFQKGAVDEIVDAVTKPEYKDRLVMVLAGYAKEMQDLMRTNPGLASRFETTIQFHPLPGKACLDLLCDKLNQAKLDTGHLSESFRANCALGFDELTKSPLWGNARDVEKLARLLVRKAHQRLGRDPHAVFAVSEMDIVQVCAALHNQLYEPLEGVDVEL